MKSSAVNMAVKKRSILKDVDEVTGQWTSHRLGGKEHSSEEPSPWTWSVTQVISTQWNFLIKYFKSQQQKWNFRENALQNYHLHVRENNFDKFWSCWFVTLVNLMVDSSCPIIICHTGVNGYPHLYTETKFTSLDSIYDNFDQYTC